MQGSPATTIDSAIAKGSWGEIFRTSENLWKNPLRWEKKAAKRGKAVRVFTCSESDFFHQGADEWRPEAWQIIKDTPHLLYQILTKRPGRIASHLPPDWGSEGYANVWLGVSAACNQSMVQIDKLRAVPTRTRFVSAEPLLEDISQAINLDGIGWLIAGGESGFGPGCTVDSGASKTASCASNAVPPADHAANSESGFDCGPERQKCRRVQASRVGGEHLAG